MIGSNLISCRTDIWPHLRPQPKIAASSSAWTAHSEITLGSLAGVHRSEAAPKFCWRTEIGKSGLDFGTLAGVARDPKVISLFGAHTSAPLSLWTSRAVFELGEEEMGIVLGRAGPRNLGRRMRQVSLPYMQAAARRSSTQGAVVHRRASWWSYRGR